MKTRTTKTSSLHGTVHIPGDKSISHRVLLLSALAEGEATFTNLGTGADVRSTAACLQQLGVDVVVDGSTARVASKGMANLQSPSADLDCGNSGTSIRLLSGVVAGAQLAATLVGDEGLSKRPMKRVLGPLSSMGAQAQGIDVDGKTTPPLTFTPSPLHGVDHVLPIASAQVKSCCLLAGLFADGATTVVEPHLSRDHTERMLQSMGADLVVEGDGRIRLTPGQTLSPLASGAVPGDPSSAAFFAVAASLVDEADVVLPHVDNNPTRAGYLKVLQRMGANVDVVAQPNAFGDEVCDLRIRAPKTGLQAATIAGADIPALVDEVPILAVLATQADGVTEIRDAHELRVKECDRLAAMAEGLNALGANVEELDDGLRITGPTPLHGGDVVSHGDHRIAISLTIAGLVADGDVVVDGAEWAGISYPAFFDELRALGAHCVDVKDDKDEDAT